MQQSQLRIFIIFSLGFLSAAVCFGQENRVLIKEGEKWYYDGKEDYYDGDYRSAQIKYDKALEIYTKNLKSPNELLFKIHYRILRNETNLRNIERARKMGAIALENAIAVFGNKSQEVGNVYNAFGLLAAKEHRYNESIEFTNKAIAVQTELSGAESEDVAMLLVNNANTYSDLGDHNKSLAMCDLALRIYKKTLKEDDESYNRLYLNLSNVYRSKGDLQKALEFGEEALRIKLKNYEPTHPSIAKYYANIAKILASLKNFKESEKYFKKGLEITKYNEGLASISYGAALSDMARIYAMEEHLNEAVKIYNEVEKIYVKANADVEKTYPLIQNRAICKYDLGEQEVAIRDILKINEGLARRKKDNLDFLVQNHLLLASFYRHLDDLMNASQSIEQAKSYASEIGLGDASSLMLLDIQDQEIKLMIEKGGASNLILAQNKIEQSIEQLVKLRKSYLGRSSKDYINKQLADNFELAIESALLLKDLDPEIDIVEYVYENIEKAKAASFWDSESEQNANNFGGAPKVELEQLEYQKFLIADVEQELLQTEETEMVGLLKDSLFNAKRVLDEQYAHLEKTYPKFYQLKYSLDMSKLDAFQLALENGIAVLDYFFLEDRLICLLVTKKYSQIVTTALNDSLTTLLETKKTNFNQAERRMIYNLTFAQVDAILRDEGIKRVSIIPHRELHYLSFEQMSSPESKQKLLYDYAFSYQLRSSDIINEDQNAKVDGFLGLAPNWNNNSLQINQGDLVSRDFLVSLPGTVDEVRIASELTNGEILLDEDASEYNFKMQAPNYNMLHFATHAHLDPENDANSCLYLSEAQREINFGQEDGKLYSNEIADLELNAELVILSACNTGNGKLNSGEGVMSLSRAFKFAGASSILMSLWLSNDQSAVPIITGFVENIQKGMPKDVALQKAKIQYLERADPMMKDEFYWAGFLINGDLSPIESSSSLLYWLILPFIMILLFGFYRFRGRTMS